MPPRLPALLLVLLAAMSASGAERPSRAAQQKVLALHEHSGVLVHGPRGSGPGVFVGAEGQVLTSVQYVSLESARVEHQGQVLPATVMLASAHLKVALVAAPPGSYPAVPVSVLPEGLAGKWLIGVVRGRGKKQRDRPVTARARKAAAPFIDVGLPLPPGSPLFDLQGQLVAIAVQRRGHGCRALPLEAVKRHLSQEKTP